MFFLGLVYHSISKIPKNVFVLISFFSATYVSVCSNKTDKNWKGNSTLGWCHRQFCHPVRPETPSSETNIVGDILWHLRNLSQVWPRPNTSMHCISPNSGFSIRNGVDGRIWAVGGDILKDGEGVFFERRTARVSRGVRGHAPPENFENLGLLECISRILGHE